MSRIESIRSLIKSKNDLKKKLSVEIGNLKKALTDLEENEKLMEFYVKIVCPDCEGTGVVVNTIKPCKRCSKEGFLYAHKFE